MSKRKFVRSSDSPSLYNYTVSPGWTVEEAETLRLAIACFGVGRWSHIMASGCLPGKTPAQLNLQCQRMLGQQSTGEFMGIRLEMKSVYSDNQKKEKVLRKSGLIINTGNNPTPEQRKRQIAENQKKYGLSDEKVAEYLIQLKTKISTHNENNRRIYLDKLKKRLIFLEAALQLKKIKSNDPSQKPLLKKKLSITNEDDVNVDSDADVDGVDDVDAAEEKNINLKNNKLTVKKQSSSKNNNLSKKRKINEDESDEVDDEIEDIDDDDDDDDDDDGEYGKRKSTKRRKKVTPTRGTRTRTSKSGSGSGSNSASSSASSGSGSGSSSNSASSSSNSSSNSSGSSSSESESSDEE